MKNKVVPMDYDWGLFAYLRDKYGQTQIVNLLLVKRNTILFFGDIVHKTYNNLEAINK